MIVIKVMERDMIVTTTSRITSGSVNLPVKFHFKGDEWDDLVKTAVFIGSGEERDVALITDECAVPADVLAEAGGDLKIGVYGRLANGATVIPTIWGRVQYIYEGTEMGEPSPHDPEPDWTAQVQQAAATALTKAQAVEEAAARGDFDGVSPEVTIDTIAHGHSVTITDEEHPEGQSFPVLDGASAYEQAVAGGYTGTEAQFNQELKSFKSLSEQAAGSATQAAGSASAAAGSETAAAGSASAAAGAASAAAGSASAAEQSAIDAAAAAEATGGSETAAAASATAAAESATAAADSATAAEEHEYDAEAWADGERKGSPVGSTDKTYHNNAKYYAQQAGASATAAGQSVDAAAESATAAASSATAAGNAQTAAEDAQEAAETAQAAAESARDTAITTLQTEGAAQRTAIQQKGAETLASIPEDYTDLSGDVADLKSALDVDLGKTIINETAEIVNAASKTIAKAGIDNLMSGIYNLSIDYSGNNFNYVLAYFYNASNEIVFEKRINAPGTYTIELNATARKVQFYVYLTAAETATVHVTVKTIGNIDTKFDNLESAINTVNQESIERDNILQKFINNDAIDEILHGMFERKAYNVSSGDFAPSTTRLAITNPVCFKCDIAVKAMPGYAICIIDINNPPTQKIYSPGGYITSDTIFYIEAVHVGASDFPVDESVNILFEPIETSEMFQDSTIFVDRLKSQITYAYLDGSGQNVVYYQHKHLMNVNKITAEKDVYIVNPLSDTYFIKVTIYDTNGNVIFNNYANKANPIQIRKGQLFRLTFEKATDIDVDDVFFGAQVCLSDSIYLNNPDQSDIIPALSNKGLYRENDSGKRYTAMVFTDIHADLPRFYRIMDYINKTPELDSGICLGDIADDNYAQTDGTWYTNAVNACDKPFYSVIGNHDGGNSTDMSKSATVEQVFAKWIEPTKGKIGIPDLSKSYYSKTFDEYKLCLIVLNDFDVPDTIVDGAFAVSRGQQCYSQAQINWLIQTLQAVPANYHVAILQHWIGFDNQAVNNEFSQYGFNRIYIDPAYEDIITDIVNAWQNGSTLSKSYAPIKYSDYLQTLTVSCDYTSRGSGVFIGYISGHLHRDFIGKSTKYASQNVIGLCMSTVYANYSDLPRKIGTKSEDVVTSISFDTVNRTMILNRIGACVTDRATVKQFAKVSY